jgi:hypothetical protein
MPEPSMKIVEKPVAPRTEREIDPLRPARGLVRAVMVGIILWILILAGVFIVWTHHG